MKQIRYCIVIVFLGLSFATRAQAPFTPGNVVVARTGAIGNSGLTIDATPLFLDEYTPAGNLVQSIAMPVATDGVNRILTSNGTSIGEGYISLSSDAKYLIVAGYNAPVGTANVTNTTSATVSRVIGIIDGNGTINTSTALTDFASPGNPKSAVSTNGTNIWGLGNGAGLTLGTRYMTIGATTSTRISAQNYRVLNISDGQLYVSTTTTIGKLGVGLPISGTLTAASLPGVSAGSPWQYFFADMDPGTSGVDVLYIADDNVTVGGIRKFSLVSGTWISNGTIGDALDAYRGLTGIVSGTSVQLYAVRKGGSTATGGGELVTLVDATGYNGSIAGTPTLIASAFPNTAFRGVALVPTVSCSQPSISSFPSSYNICANNQVTLSVTAAGSMPLNYQWYMGNSGDESILVGSNSSSFNSPILSSTTNYWVKISNACSSINSGTATINVYSTATWTGTVNNDFNNGNNWTTGCVPTATMSVIIPSGSPTLSSGSTTVRNITVQNGATLNLNDDAFINVIGDFLNDGVVASGGSSTNGKIVLNGISLQNLGGSGTFSNIEIDNPVGVNVITDLIVSKLLLLINAKLTVEPLKVLTVLQ